MNWLWRVARGLWGGATTSVVARGLWPSPEDYEFTARYAFPGELARASVATVRADAKPQPPAEAKP